MAIVIVLIIAIVVIVFLVLKSRRGELSLKKSDGKYDDIVHFILTILSLLLYIYAVCFSLYSLLNLSL